MELNEVIKTKRSARKYKGTSIPEEVLNEMLESARLAPSGGNAQGHVFGVIKDKEVKDKLAMAADEQMWIATAPIVFACCAHLDWYIAKQLEDDFGLIVNKLRFNNDFWIISAVTRTAGRVPRCLKTRHLLIPAEHIFLTAVSFGLCACFVGYLDIETVDKILNLPENITCLYLLPVGYSDETPKVKQRKDMSEIVFYDQWKK